MGALQAFIILCAVKILLMELELVAKNMIDPPCVHVGVCVYDGPKPLLDIANTS
jgi:hypothetical protein